MLGLKTNRFGVDSDDDQAGPLIGDGLSLLFDAPPQVTPAEAGSAATTPSATIATDPAPASSSTYDVYDNIIAQERGGVLPYGGALAVLRAACQSLTTGWMTSALFSELTAVADDLVNGSISASKYVKQMFENVVLGSSANATFNGGADQSIALGDLSATSRRWVFNDLLDKWFLGGDMPGVALTPGASSSSTSYQAYTLPLFASAGPELTDVNQGALGDCWFLAAAAETALLDPSLIEGMFTAHGNGSYAVRFEVDGQADYVTVNGELPTNAGAAQADGSQMAFASSNTSLWVPLLEKALAQLSEQSGVATGVQYAGGDDQYYDLQGGFGEGIGLITGQAVSEYDLRSQSSLGLTRLLGTLETTLAAGDDVVLATHGSSVTDNLVPDHMFAVTAINVSTGMVTLYNPWGANSAAAHHAESFSIAASVLVGDQDTFYAAQGAVTT